jgi:hypothetical protein
MFHALGVGGGGSLVGGVAVLLSVIPFLFYKYGAAIRARSRFNPRAKPPPQTDVEANNAVLEDPNEGESEDTESESSGSSTVGEDETGEKTSDEKHTGLKPDETHAHTEASASTEKVKSEEASS